jgi:hypothetical protein
MAMPWGDPSGCEAEGHLKRYRPQAQGIFLFFACAAVSISGQDMQQSRTESSNLHAASPDYNPPPFQRNAVSPSGPVLFLLSPQGKRMAARHPNVAGLMKSWGMNLPSPPPPTELLRTSLPAVSLPPKRPCDAAAGALFNLEPTGGAPELGIAVPQNEESVDYIPSGGQSGADLVIEGANDYRGIFDSAVSTNGAPPPNAWGFSATGYYVHRAGNDCAPSFEGGLPHVVFSPTSENLYGFGDPVIAADATRNRLYAADLRLGGTATGIGLFASTADTLNDVSKCPNGTHLTDGNGLDTTASLCWPSKALLNAQPAAQNFSDKPHMRVDERASGIGAGNVYVTFTNFNLAHGTSSIGVIACPATFSSGASCSPPITISGADPQTQFSHISIRPDGVVTITYINLNVYSTRVPGAIQETFDIRYVSCVPNGAPLPPTCAQPVPVVTEEQPLYFSGNTFIATLAANTFRVSTYPTHDVRKNGNLYEEFIVWSRCKSNPLVLMGKYYFDVTCSDADLVMTWAPTDSAGRPLVWASVTPFDAREHDQIMPWVRTDHSRNLINVAYLTSRHDTYGHRLQTAVAQIEPGRYERSQKEIVLNPVASEPNADDLLGSLFFGDYIGMASRGNGMNSRSYVGFTGTSYRGNVQGIMVPGQNNLISETDY